MSFLNNAWSNISIKKNPFGKFKLLFFLLFCIICMLCAKIISSAESSLKGILSIETKTYHAAEKFGEIEKMKLNRVEFEKFNEYGDLMERVVHDSDENDGINYVDNTVILIYNDNRKIKEVNTYSSDGNLIDKIIYKYGETGKIKQENDYYSDVSIQTKKTYKYDALGKLLGWGTEYFTPKGNSPETTYNNETIVNSINETDVKYSMKGNVEEIKYNKNQKIICKYDANGNLLEKVEITKWEHDNESDSSSSIHPVKMKTKIFYDTLKSTYKYDDKNNLIEYEVPANKSTYKYYFDENGKWIKRIQFKDDEPDEISERLIVYY